MSYSAYTNRLSTSCADEELLARPVKEAIGVAIDIS